MALVPTPEEGAEGGRVQRETLSAWRAGRQAARPGGGARRGGGSPYMLCIRVEICPHIGVLHDGGPSPASSGRLRSGVPGGLDLKRQALRINPALRESGSYGLSCIVTDWQTGVITTGCLLPVCARILRLPSPASRMWPGGSGRVLAGGQR